MVSDGQLWADTEILAEILSKVRNWFENATVFKGVLRVALFVFELAKNLCLIFHLMLLLYD